MTPSRLIQSLLQEELRRTPKRKPPPSRPAVLAAGPEPLALSSLTPAELPFGAALSARPEANRRRLRTFAGEIATVPFDDRCGEHFGRIKAESTGAGRPIPDFDIAIGATAFARGRVLISSDRHMTEVASLPFEDWTAATGV